MAEITVLKQINDFAFKQKVLMRLMNANAILLLKDKYGRTLPLKVDRLEEQTKFYCTGAVKLDLDFSYSENYTAHFMIDTEKYMFETTPHIENGHVVLSIVRIFHLQNRQTVRYKVPHDAQLKLVIGALNEVSCLLDCSVADLNSHGCSVIVNAPKTQLQAQDLIDATLINGSEGSIHLQGIIRNVRPHGPEQFAVGIEFHHMLYCGEDKLTSMISELHQRTHLKSS